MLENWLSLSSQMITRVLIQGTIAVLVLWLLESTVRSLSPTYRCWLWRAAYLKILLAALIPWSLLVPIMPPRLDASSAHSPSKITATGAGQETQHLTTDLSSNLGTNFNGATAGNDRPVSAFRSSILALSSYWPVAIVTLCFTSIVIGLVRTMEQWSQSQSLVRRATRIRILNHPVSQIVESLQPQLGLRKGPRLYWSEHISSPVLTGFYHSCIVLPKELAGVSKPMNDREIEDLRMALAHELAHMKRGDLLWNVIVYLLHLPFSFHPVFWLSLRRYQISVELACDARALRTFKVDRRKFADLLIRVAKRRTRLHWSIAGVPLVQSRSGKLLRERLLVMHRKQVSRWQRAITLGLSTVVVACAMTPWSFGQSTGDEQQAPSRTSPTAKKPNGTSATATASGSFFGSGSGFGAASGSASGSASGKGSVTASASVSGSTNVPQPTYNSSGSDPSSSNSASIFFNQSASAFNNGNSNVSITREANDDGELTRVLAKERSREISIRHSSVDGIEIRIAPVRRNGASKEKVFLAATLDDLKATHPEAFRIYRKYLPEGNLVVGNDAPVVNDQAAKVDIGAQQDAAPVFGGNPAERLLKMQLEQMRQLPGFSDEHQNMIRKMMRDMSNKQE